MLAPTPILPPRPLEVGDVFSSSFRILRTHLGLFLGLAALGVLVPMLLSLLPLMGGFVVLIGQISFDPPTLPNSATLGAFALMAVGMLVGGSVAIKFEGLVIEAAYQGAQGNSVTIGEVFRANRGFLRRVLPFVLLVGVGVFLVIALLGVAFLAPFASQSREVGPLAILAIVPVLLALLLVAIFLGIKWFYVYPAAALEGSGGLAAAGRSWRLTKGAFGRTLGYYLLATLVIALVQIPLSLLMQAMGVGPSGSIDPEFAAANPAIYFAVWLPLLLFSLTTQSVVQLVVWPFIVVYRTVMFLDQVKRTEFAQANGHLAPPFHPGQRPPVG